jgi:hypothetical protein
MQSQLALGETPKAPQITVDSITPFPVTENTTVVVRGEFLGFTTEVVINGELVPFTLLDSGVFTEVALMFVVPPQRISPISASSRRLLAQSASQFMTFTITPCHSLCGIMPGAGALPYSTSECAVGELEVNAKCRKCPEGGYCPRGELVWPLRGYASTSDTTMPIKCGYPDACLGMRLEDGDVDRFTIATTQCEEGYEGDYCSRCSEDYFPDGFRCRPCSRSIFFGGVTPIYIAFFFFLFVGILVVSLPTRKLVQLLVVFLGMQKLSMVLFAGTPYVDSPGLLVDVLEVWCVFFGLFNMELDITKPGCYMPRVSFFAELYGTLVFAVFVVLAYVGLYALRRKILAPVMRCADSMDTFYTKDVLPKVPKCLRKKRRCYTLAMIRSLMSDNKKAFTRKVRISAHSIFSPCPHPFPSPIPPPGLAIPPYITPTPLMTNPLFRRPALLML